VRQVDELVAEIATASKEQDLGISQVNTAVSQMDKVTQSNAASAEESASAAEELNAQTITLRSVVADLQQIVSGKSAQTGTAVSATQHEQRVSAPHVARTAPVPKNKPAARKAAVSPPMSEARHTAYEAKIF
jgi:ABC-type transporter Mla subunit MlaD